WPDSDAIGASWLRRRPGALDGSRGRKPRHGVAAIKRPELSQRDMLDVPTDAPLAERQRHPRLEVLDEPGRSLRMRVEIVVEPVGVRVHQLLQPRGTRGVLGLHAIRVDEELRAQVAKDHALA